MKPARKVRFADDEPVLSFTFKPEISSQGGHMIQSVHQKEFSKEIGKIQKPTKLQQMPQKISTWTKQSSELHFQNWPQYGKVFGKRHVTFLRAELLRKKRKKVLEEIGAAEGKVDPCEHRKDAASKLNSISIPKNSEGTLLKLECNTFGSPKRMKTKDTGGSPGSSWSKYVFSTVALLYPQQATEGFLILWMMYVRFGWGTILCMNDWIYLESSKGV